MAAPRRRFETALASHPTSHAMGRPPGIPRLPRCSPGTSRWTFRNSPVMAPWPRCWAGSSCHPGLYCVASAGSSSPETAPLSCWATLPARGVVLLPRPRSIEISAGLFGPARGGTRGCRSGKTRRDPARIRPALARALGRVRGTCVHLYSKSLRRQHPALHHTASVDDSSPGAAPTFTTTDVDRGAATGVGRLRHRDSARV